MALCVGFLFYGAGIPSNVGRQLEILILPTPGEAKAKAMPGRLYIHTK